MQYTGLSEVTGNEPPTYANCGTDDWIANYRVMNNRINKRWYSFLKIFRKLQIKRFIS